MAKEPELSENDIAALGEVEDVEEELPEVWVIGGFLALCVVACALGLVFIISHVIR